MKNVNESRRCFPSVEASTASATAECSSRTTSDASTTNFVDYGNTVAVAPNSPIDSEMGVLLIENNPKNGQFKTTEEVLARLGWKNYKLIYIVVSMAFVWGLAAMPIMSTAFAVEGIKCPTPNDTHCLEEKERFYSIEKQFHLVPDPFYNGELFGTIFLFGNMFVGTFLGYLADIVGRRVIVVGSIFAMGVFGCLCAISNSFPLLLIMRFFQGGFFTPSSMVNWVIASECISINYHGHASMVFGLWWVFGYCIVAGIAYILPNWQHLMLAASIPSIIFGILFWFTIPESFQFLVEKGKRAETKKWIENVENPKDRLNCDVNYLFESIQAQDADEIQEETSFRASMQFLLSHKKYLVYLFAAILIWIIDMFVYQAMSFLSTGLSGNAYLSYVYSGLAEIPAYVFSPMLMDRIGRKKSVIVSHIFTGVSLFPLIFIPASSNLYIAFWLLGKFGIASCFIALFVYGAEIFPTIVRNTCLGTCAFFGNVGGMLGFQYKFLAEINPVLPVILYTIASFAGGLITFVFPETISHHHHLP